MSGGTGRRSATGAVAAWAGSSSSCSSLLLLAGVVLVVALTALRPVVTAPSSSWAEDNPAALRLPFVADLVREDIGDGAHRTGVDRPDPGRIRGQDGDTASAIATRLGRRGSSSRIRARSSSSRASASLTEQLQPGTFVLRKNMTPDQIVRRCSLRRPNPYVEIALRTGLRLEQITAKLQTLDGLQMDPREFYDLAKEPPAELLADYPWLKTVLADAPTAPRSRASSGRRTYRVLPDTTPEELIRKMLDGFHEAVGDRMNVRRSAKMTSTRSSASPRSSSARRSSTRSGR